MAIPGIKEEFKMGEMEGKAALIRADGMGSKK